MRRATIFLLVLAGAQAAQAGTVFVNLGTAAPPAMVGPFPMTPFATAPQAAIPDGDLVFEIPGTPFAGTVGLSQGLMKRTVPTSFPNWSHGYQGPVFLAGTSPSSVTLFLPSNTRAFYLYAQPVFSGSHAITVTTGGGTSSGPIAVNANGGARGFAFYATDDDSLGSITVESALSAGGFALAEFGLATRQSECELTPIAIGATVDGMWTDECFGVAVNGSLARFFTFSLAAPMGVQVELESDLCSVVVLRQGHGFFGNEIAGDFCNQSPARVNVSLAAGDYTIEATNFGFGATGSFTLRLARGGSCSSDFDTLCIDGTPGDRRFEIRVDYQTVQGGGAAGAGRAVPLADLGVVRGGLFWFFDAGNPELLIKVLAACGVNGHYWVFWSAGTNVGMTVTVTDTVAELTRTYTNPDVHPALPVQDVMAFPCD
jgi:hypothetical protein